MSKPRGARWLWLDQVRDRVRKRTLSESAGHVALVLAVYYVNGRGEAWPSQVELAAASGRSLRVVRKAIAELVREGLLEVRRGRPARTSGNVYRLVNAAPRASFPKRESVTA
jgi:hypothetical protein